jgi:tetraacyldisaccharide 4'-kinase
VAVASRGYGRRGSEPVVVVSDGLRISADLDRAGDEPLWLAAQLPGVPVLVGRDRGRVGRAAHAMFGVEVVVLDDGMQHYRLARDVEIAVLDGRDGVGNGWCVPRGRLREPLAGLARADAIVVLSGPLRPDHEARVAAAAPDALRISGSRRATQLAPIDGLADPGARLSLDWLRGREVGALAAIAQPSALVASLENLGAKVVALRAFRDHRRYRARDLRGLAREAPVWVTTEKDALKLRPSWLRGAGLFVLGEEIEIEAADRMLAWLAQRLATR